MARHASQHYFPAIARYRTGDSPVQVRFDEGCAVADVHEIEHLVRKDDKNTSNIPSMTPAHLDTKVSCFFFYFYGVFNCFFRAPMGFLMAI